MIVEKSRSESLQKELYDLIKEDGRIFDFIENSCLNGFWFIDKNELENNWKNKKFNTTLGYSNNEIVNISPKELDEFFKAINLLDSKNETMGKVSFANKNGLITNFSFAIYDKILNTNKLLVGFQIENANIAIDNSLDSQKKEDFNKSRERFESATNSASIGVWEYNLNDKSVIWDRAMFKLYDVAENEFNNLKEAFFARVHPEDSSLVSAATKNAILNASDLDVVFRIICKNGDCKYLKTNARIAIDENNSPIQLIGITYDITEQKTSELAIKHAKELAEAASVSKSEFLANMSHEIRTPLNGVIGFIDLLMKTKLDQTQTQYMNTVFQSANSLLEIINDILDFSKIEAGKLELSNEEIDIFELGSQVTDIIKFQAHSKELEVLLKISPKIPQFIIADSVRLRQVLVNLLGNAIKFTENGEIELKVEVLTQKTKDQSIFRFSVRDTGVGIDSKNQLKIFEAFSQEDATISRKFGGTGLGLTISNKLLSLMGSKLEIKSEIGVGSTFYFDILLNSKAGKLADWKQLNEINRVLIVDDNASNKLVLQQMFALKYVRIDVAKNGIEALEKLTDVHDYDVILMDYHMPYLDGIETVKNIRNKLKLFDKELPIILLQSSTDDEELKQICDELFIQHVLVKPVKNHQLFECLLKIQNKEEVKERKKIIPKKDLLVNAEDIHILIADDNAINMMLTKSIFKSLIPNAIIHEAKNGIEAVSMFIKQRPDIIFMDIQMPEMNGYKAALEIRKFEKEGHIPIIALTAGTVKGEKERCLRSGMDDYLSKPIVTSTIERSIIKWLDYSNGFYKKREKMENNETNMHFDIEKLRDRLDNDDDLIMQLLGMTKEYLVDFIPTLEHLISKGDKAAIKSHVHKMKGTALSVCFNNFALQTIELEAIQNYNDYSFVNLKSSIITEISYLINMIDEKTANLK